MKVTDDYLAKYRIWAANPQVMPAGKPPKLPRFAPQKFRTHEEMNRWKEKLLLQMAQDKAHNG